jgi:outer membrane biosynthesis protein TonB
VRAEELKVKELRHGVALSSMMHVLLLATVAFLFRNPLSTEIVAAGEGAGTGGAIEVGVISASQLGFTRPEPVALIGEKANEENTKEVITRRPDPPRDAEVLPRNQKKREPELKAKEKNVVTDRPTAPRSEQVVSPKPLKGSSDNTNVTVGRSYGTPVPQVSGGIGIATAAGGGTGTSGVPGGSEYGRRIQMILSRNYNPPQIPQANQTQYVIIQLRISRDGQILSLSGGRVASRYIKQTSPFDLVNRAAERAVIASNPLPPFPGGFLGSAQEAVADIWFRYPK